MIMTTEKYPWSFVTYSERLTSYSGSDNFNLTTKTLFL